MMFRLIILLLLMEACSLTSIDDSIDLGSQYRYIQDKPQVIIHHETDEYQGGGVNAVPPQVLSYAFNDRFIVAKSLHLDDAGNQIGSEPLYWIIDKESTDSQIASMDSTHFYNQLDKLRIDLILN